MSIVRIASDLHLEFFKNVSSQQLEQHFVPPDERDGQSVLLLAGDISSIPGQLLDFLYAMDERFKAVVYVPGNHEYYGHQLQEWNRSAIAWRNAFKRTEIAGGEVRTKTIEGVHFIASTLWGSGGETDEERSNLKRGLADFHAIRWAGRKFTPKDMADLHRQHRSHVASALREMGGPKVVVTHHLPSLSLCHPRFGTSINGGFASDCDSLMQDQFAPVLWVHGHTHDTIDTVIGRTRVVCNPAGYRPEWVTAHNTFSPKFVELAA